MFFFLRRKKALRGIFRENYRCGQANLEKSLLRKRCIFWEGNPLIIVSLENGFVVGREALRIICREKYLWESKPREESSDNRKNCLEKNIPRKCHRFGKVEPHVYVIQETFNMMYSFDSPCLRSKTGRRTVPAGLLAKSGAYHSRLSCAFCFVCRGTVHVP